MRHENALVAALVLGWCVGSVVWALYLTAW